MGIQRPGLIDKERQVLLAAMVSSPQEAIINKTLQEGLLPAGPCFRVAHLSKIVDQFYRPLIGDPIFLAWELVGISKEIVIRHRGANRIKKPKGHESVLYSQIRSKVSSDDFFII